jgi:hypothetical protein
MVNLVKEEYLKKVPDWYKSDEAFDVVLSDDIDGIVSTSILNCTMWWNVGYYYDFTTLYCNCDTYFTENKTATRVWADVAIIKEEKAFDNHVSRKNKEDRLNNLCINPNIINGITQQNYFDKYCGSTALLIWSLYDIPLPESELGKMLLLSIDSTFKGFYGSPRFKAANHFYLCDMFGFEELYECEKRHTKDEFYDLFDKYNLSKKTRIDKDGHLHTDLDLEVLSKELGIPVSVPDDSFIEYQNFEKKRVGDFYYPVKSIPQVVTAAYVGCNAVMYSKLA